MVISLDQGTCSKFHKVDDMRRMIRSFPISFCLVVSALILVSLPRSSSAVDAVCGTGTGVPPFLSSGIDPNLLLVLDNSGSMLDTAYTDKTGDGACVDNDFIPYDPLIDGAAYYAGLFDPEKWYEWQEGARQWHSGTAYTIGTYVYTEGMFYKATSFGTSTSPGTSTGATIDEDTGVVWDKVYEIPVWQNGVTYAAKTFVQYQGQLYYTAAGGTANDGDGTDGISIEGDSGITDWDDKDSTWLNGVTYASGAVVSDNGMLYYTTAGGTSSGTGVKDDAGVTWTRLDEGKFVEASYTSQTGAAAALSSKAGTAYQQADLYVKIKEVGGVKSTVTAFAASGNLLNWASTSKLDIQKKILTGGKYDEDDNLLVSEGRGCSSRGYIKEVPVNGDTLVITFSIRGFEEDDWIDTLDNTTRISILGVKDKGFIGDDRQKACQTAINEISLGADGSLGTIQTNIDKCLSYDLTQNNVLAASNAAYNHSVFTCWSIVKKGFDDPSDIGNVSEIENACEGVYNTGVYPATIDPYDSGYMCYGVYSTTIADPLRDGYVGRCYEPGDLPPGCKAKACASPYVQGTGDPQCFPDGYVYKCSGNYNLKKNSCTGTWKLELEDIPPDGNAATTEDDLVCVTTATGTPGIWTDDNNTNGTDACIQQAMWDYCGSLKIPEVIDPTDQLSNSSETWGMVGALVDSGIAAMFGSNRPLIVMKGYIVPPVDENGVTVVPQGVIHDVQDDLRMGAMAFNVNGAATECQSIVVNDTIVQYCPKDTLDGAHVIASIKNSDATTDGEPHIEFLTHQINDIRANSWTPLGEAMFNALGYYGQNSSMRINQGINNQGINQDDFTISAEDDPVKAWCQANNILMITEGASTADINAAVKSKIDSLAGTMEDPTVLATNEGECTVNNNHYLYASTYLDDLTYFGSNAIDSANNINAGIYATPQMPSDDGKMEDKQNIRTYIISTGTSLNTGITGECNAKTLMENAAVNGGTELLSGESPEKLKESLTSVLNDILTRASAGSAASVISSARGGEGAIYQAIFWPELETTLGTTKYKVGWVGDVHGLFIDDSGFMYEDTNQNRTLDLDTSNGTTDKRVVIYYDTNEKKSKACYGETAIVSGQVTCTDSINLQDVKYLWSANTVLSISTDVQTNRSLTAGGGFDFVGAEGKKRYIFTWNDLDHDGIVDNSSEVVALEKAANPTSASWNAFAKNFKEVDGYGLNNLIGWLRGDDWAIDEDLDDDGVWDAGLEVDTDLADGPRPRDPYRSRTSVSSSNALFTWRLGDIINSTPQTVTSPSEGYHLIYSDASYAQFVARYKKRRHVVYFGGNDGMMHAVNGGFYSDVDKKFCLQEPTADGKCPVNDGTATISGVGIDTAPALGAELWAYVPYNLQPHLKCLAEPFYAHKYYVDLKPRVFDAQIFTPDTDHPNGWGTILVGGLRFGGTPVDVGYDDNGGTKQQPYVSSYFILDISNPEKPPVLLGELTQEYDASSQKRWVDLGYTTVIPTMVINKTSTANEWYLVFGSGPHGSDGLKGVSDQQPRVSILNLNKLVDKTIGMRIPSSAPTAGTNWTGTYFLPGGSADTTAPKGFVSDPITMDFDINPSVSGEYISDAVYFGTVEGDFDYNASLPYWKGGGQMYRLVMNPAGHTIRLNNYLNPGSWGIKPLLDLSGDVAGNPIQPITGAASVGTDGNYYWIYFGTGRFFDKDDKTDTTQQTFYGIKEPITISGLDTTVTWDEVELNGTGSNPLGGKGLLQVDEILVPESSAATLAQLACRNNADGTVAAGDYSCLPTGLNSAGSAYFNKLETYIAGTGSCASSSLLDNCVDGWYKKFYPYNNRERNLGQATLLGGLVTYTTYQPFSDICKAEGNSYLYAVYYKTGTSWYKNIFGEYGIENTYYVSNKLNLGIGLTTTPNLFTGSGDEGIRAFIQTSTGEIREIKEDNLPVQEYKTGRSRWLEYQRP